MTDKPTKSEMTWTIELYREYCELHRRNYLLDDLWGPDEKKCSDEFSRFVNLDRFFSPIDNRQMLFNAFDTLKQENEELRRANGEAGKLLEKSRRLLEEKAALLRERDELIEDIDKTLQVPTAEYVPVIGKVFRMIDRFKNRAALKGKT